MMFLSIVGCAKTQVTTRAEIADSGLARPERVLVYDFAVSPADIQGNSSIFAKLARNLQQGNQTAEEMQLGREVADALAAELVRKIQDMGLNAQRANQNLPVALGSIAVTGRFVKIDEGNRLRRNVIGLGLGQSSIDCEIRVLAPFSSGPREIVAFNSHADSGNMPGAAVLGPAGAAAGAGTAAVVASNVAMGGMKSYRSSAAQQAKNIADKISIELSHYFAKQGWISPSLAR